MEARDDDPATLRAEVRRRAATIAGSPLADDDLALDHAASAAGRDDDVAALAAALEQLRAVPRVDPDTHDGEEPPDRTGEILARLDATERALGAALDVLRSPTHRHRSLEGEIDALRDRLRRSERTTNWIGADDPTAALLSRIEALETVERARRFEPWYPTERFEAAFRGPTDELLRRYEDLADRIAEAASAAGGQVLDIGCGRGDLLELLRRRDVDARGVDLDADAIDDARARGLAVEVADGLEALRRAPSSSLGGVTAVQVLEHLTPQLVTEFVALAADRLKPGGIAVAETVNPLSLYVYTHAMWLDPTHTQPIHPAYLDFLFREAGFSTTVVELRSAVPDAERLGPIDRAATTADEGLVDQLDERIARLDQALFGPQDYAVLAHR